MARSLLVVGYGMVAHRFLEELAARDADGRWQVTVIAEEPRPAYDRVHLSSLFDGATPQDLCLVGEGFLDRHGITVRYGDAVTAIDRAARTVTTARGGVIAYDALVLATGSYPFVPPVPGHDAAGAFVYRTVEDLAAIRAYADGRRVGAVVGGGLLGLEAAGALRSLGMDTHVVEFAPRLMPVQVDEGGGEVLRRRIEGLGVTVHTGARTEAIETDAEGRVRRMVFGGADGGAPPDAPLDVDLVVFSAGIRPRDALARESGLPVGARGGVVVDEACATADPAVYAIGECAQAADGRVYGLVAPGYAMAEALADRLTGGAAAFTGADTSTKLKLLGVDVASFGDAHGVTPGAMDVTFTDTTAGVYKKLLVSEDGRLLGGILVGDAEAYATLRGFTGSDAPLPASPDQLILPASAGGPALGSGSLPDAATICSCHNVSKGAIRTAIAEHDCRDVAGVKACTRAGTGCGSCLPLLKTILADELTASGIEVSTALCEHFDASRAELFEIVKVRGFTTFAELIRAHGRGHGCDICRPAVASILASLGGAHILHDEQAALQDTNDHFLANLQRNGSYSVVPRIPGGEITPEGLITIGEIARDFGLYTKITGGQRIDMFGARVEELPRIWRRLVEAGFESGHAYGKALRTVKSCVGSTWCRYGVQDSVRLAIELELRYRGLRSPHKLKAAVSGCARECAEAQGKDFGVIATANGWNLYVGGNGGMSPRHADLLATDLDTATLVRTIDRFLMFYIRTADRLQRTAPWLESLEGGLDHLKAVIMDDSLGLCGELDAMMARHIANYRDEWREVLEDPELLRRFVSFVNAPDQPDPSIRFVPEREQIKPDPVPLPLPAVRSGRDVEVAR